MLFVAQQHTEKIKTWILFAQKKCYEGNSAATPSCWIQNPFPQTTAVVNAIHLHKTKNGFVWHRMYRRQLSCYTVLLRLMRQTLRHGTCSADVMWVCVYTCRYWRLRTCVCTHFTHECVYVLACEYWTSRSNAPFSLIQSCGFLVCVCTYIKQFSACLRICILWGAACGEELQCVPHGVPTSSLQRREKPDSMVSTYLSIPLILFGTF